MPAEAIVVPSILIWSRETAGLSRDDAARLISVSPAKLAAWEDGDSQPTIGQVRKMADKYKRPLNAFFLEAPPASEEPTSIPDFRSANDDSPRRLSREAILGLRRAKEWRLDVLDLHEQLEQPIVEFDWTLSPSADPEESGSSLRSHLGLNDETQFAWRRDVSGHTAFNGWRDHIESVGVLVFQASGIAIEDLRGASLYESRLPTILINSADTVRGRIFTLLHELVHVALHGSGLCDPSSLRPRARRSDPTEVYCNAVAGAALVPRELLEREIPFQRFDPLADDDGVFSALANRFSVSRYVILRRFLTLGRLNDDFFARKQAAWNTTLPRTGPSTSGGDGRRTNLSQRGRHYVRLVVSAYRESKLTRAETSRLLGLKPDDIGMASEYAQL